MNLRVGETVELLTPYTWTNSAPIDGTTVRYDFSENANGSFNVQGMKLTGVQQGNVRIPFTFHAEYKGTTALVKEALIIVNVIE